MAHRLNLQKSQQATLGEFQNIDIFRCRGLLVRRRDGPMNPFAVTPKVESLKEAMDQGHVHGLFASRLFLPPETFEEMLRTTTALWEKNGCAPRFIQIAMAAAHAAYRGEGLWTDFSSPQSLCDNNFLDRVVKLGAS